MFDSIPNRNTASCHQHMSSEPPHVCIFPVVAQLVSYMLHRLDMLERLCLTWHGWVSAAVYLQAHPSEAASQLHSAVWRLDQLHLELEHNGLYKEDSSDIAQHCIMLCVI